MGRSVEQWAALVSAHIAGCTSCVGYFGNEDGYFSIDGVHSDPDDLLMSLDVPERLRPEVLARAACGECRNSIADEAEIWVWSEAEVEFRSRVARARERYEPRLSEFRDFLAKHPYLGATAPNGPGVDECRAKSQGHCR